MKKTNKRAKSLGAVTHTHTHKQILENNKSIAKIVAYALLNIPKNKKIGVLTLKDEKG